MLNGKTLKVERRAGSLEKVQLEASCMFLKGQGRHKHKLLSVMLENAVTVQFFDQKAHNKASSTCHFCIDAIPTVFRFQPCIRSFCACAYNALSMNQKLLFSAAKGKTAVLALFIYTDEKKSI